MSIPDGGPAFPTSCCPGECKDAHEVDAPGEGMSLRDYFAAGALQGLLALHLQTFSPIQASAELAYKYADAMIKERGKV